jgi:hypothetical protein
MRQWRLPACGDNISTAEQMSKVEMQKRIIQLLKALKGMERALQELLKSIE